MNTSLTHARVEAPAKLTLSLRITGVRKDGYHLIDAEMVSLSLCDVLTISPHNTSNQATSRLSITGTHSGQIATDASNLVLRALEVANVAADVTVEKNIPAGGGLGGGSTDAAAIFRWAQFSDLESASRLGADIPFCIIGGRARVQGIGEIVTPLAYQHREITLVIPPLHVATPLVYRTWDELGGPHHESGNDLEPAAIAAVPDLAKWKNRIGDACGVTPKLAGSGATWWIEGHHLRDVDHNDTTLSGAIVVHCQTREDAGSINQVRK